MHMWICMRRISTYTHTDISRRNLVFRVSNLTRLQRILGSINTFGVLSKLRRSLTKHSQPPRTQPKHIKTSSNQQIPCNFSTDNDGKNQSHLVKILEVPATNS